MKKPLISVIIPTFNRLGPLSELVESLFRQTFQDFEIIIVNDQGEPVDRIQSLYPELQIKILTPAKKLHHVGCRNEGLACTEGSFIMLCDDDDFVVPDHLEQMADAIQDADFVYTDVEMVDFITDNGVRCPHSRTVFAYEWDRELVRKFNPYISSGSLYRKEIHQQIGSFDEEVHNYWDWDFFLRVIESGLKIKKLPAANTIYAFTPDGSNISAGLNEKRQTYLQKFSEKHNLGSLSQENFWTMMDRPFVKTKRSQSKIVWDGKPMIYRGR
ncbi:glycosyltransferase involved in cell wall bisynthesis [Bacillus oleivorans]|uniref:Glycosyltransferase involved in cell wall bisynthesis n=1 Tax=Bacillus oleivorans TaxID=1448271 RepID=A0A285CI47_9BACI|nr:glycosyltransferase [Bacillus oleivorans]SNX67277.1 glycosyltransferase involved in cell wall bisynthesis [Bacillus oleivorans]